MLSFSLATSEICGCMFLQFFAQVSAVYACKLCMQLQKIMHVQDVQQREWHCKKRVKENPLHFHKLLFHFFLSSLVVVNKSFFLVVVIMYFCLLRSDVRNKHISNCNIFNAVPSYKTNF